MTVKFGGGDTRYKLRIMTRVRDWGDDGQRNDHNDRRQETENHQSQKRIILVRYPPYHDDKEGGTSVRLEM